MTYRYEFDSTSLGNLHLRRPRYETLHAAYRQLRDALQEWNRKALDHGALEQPYRREVEDLDGMIAWGEEQLANADASEIMVRGISIGSYRYAKAALFLTMHLRREERARNAGQGWPETALRSLDDAIVRIGNFADVFDQAPSDVLWELIPRDDELPSSTTDASNGEWDVFVSHASEDKDDFVRPLAKALQARGLTVWFDELTLTLGDSLRRSIDRGLVRSRFGVVVISPSFLNKEWPQNELDGLVAREHDGTKVILPVWHNISADEIRSFSPILAGRLATRSSRGLDSVVTDIAAAIAAGTKTGETAPDVPIAPQ